jgi:putative aminopeptidase FrvX
MDTCGFIVHSISSNGLVKCVNFGYQDTSSCHLQPVEITTNSGPIKGLMYAKKENDKISFTIDIGIRSQKEITNFGVKAGDPVHFNMEPILLGDFNSDIICSPRLDNRLGVYELILLAERLSKNPPINDVYLAATVEEEVGARGAQTVATKIGPDLAIVLDATYDEFPVLMGEGPVITLSDKAVFIPLNVRDYLLQLAKTHQISVQTEVWNIGGTDAKTIRTANVGIPTIPVLTATKNAHTPYEIGCIKDCYSVVEFCEKIINNGDKILRIFHE